MRRAWFGARNVMHPGKRGVDMLRGPDVRPASCIMRIWLEARLGAPAVLIGCPVSDRQIRKCPRGGDKRTSSTRMCGLRRQTAPGPDGHGVKPGTPCGVCCSTQLSYGAEAPTGFEPATHRLSITRLRRPVWNRRSLLWKEPPGRVVSVGVPKGTVLQTVTDKLRPGWRIPVLGVFSFKELRLMLKTSYLRSYR